MAGYDFNEYRKRRTGNTSSGGGASSEGGLDFAAYRNRKVDASNVPSGSPTGTPMTDLFKSTGGMIDMNPLNSTLSRAVAGDPGAVQTYRQATGVDVNQTREQPKTKTQKLMDAVDTFNAFSNRLRSAVTFGGTEAIDRLFTKIGPEESRKFVQDELDRAKNVKGGMIADIAGSLIPGEATYRLGTSLVSPLLKNAPKAVQLLGRGAAGGALYQTGLEAGQLANQALGGPSESLANRAKDIATTAALGGAGELAFAGLGSALSKVFRRNNIPEEAASELIPAVSRRETLALPEGRGTVRQSLASERSNLSSNADPIINPTDWKPEPLAITEGTAPGPTVARTGTLSNPYRQKFESLIDEAKKHEFTPGREDAELENLWSQMAGPNDPSLDELITLAYKPRTMPQRGMVQAARSNQEARAVAGVGNPVRSANEAYPSSVTGEAAAPRTLVGRAGATPNANTGRSNISQPLEGQQLTRDQQINAKISAGGQIDQNDIEYLLNSGGNVQVDDIPNFSALRNRPRTEVNPEVNPEISTPTPAHEPAAPMQQDVMSALFGDQNMGIVAGGGSRIGGPVDTADQIVRSSIKNDKEGIKQSIAAQARSTYQNLVDSLSPLKRVGEDVYESAMDAQRANQLANTIVRDKFVNMEGQVIGESLNDIFKKVARGQDKNFLDFLNLKRATTRMARGERVYAKNLNMTLDKVNNKLQTLEQRHPGFENIANDYYNFWNNVRQLGVDEGLISQETKQALETAEPYYVPQRRQFKRSEKPGQKFLAKTSKTAFSGQKAPIQSVNPNGSGRDIVDARKSTIEAIGSWTNAILRNRTMQSIVKAVDADPDKFSGVIEFADMSDNVRQSSIKELNDLIERDGIEGMLESLDKDFDLLFNKSKELMNKSDENVVRAMVDGNPVYLKVHDPEVLKALLGMGPQASNVLIDVMAAFSNATKRGATGVLAPVFAVKGATMDLVQSAIQSKSPLKQTAYTVYSILSGVGDALNIPGLRNWAQEYRRAGGGYSALLRGERQLNKSLDELSRDPFLSPKGVVKGVKKAAMAPLNMLESVGSIAENAPRIAASKIERQSLGNEITPENIRKVMSAGREATINFSRKGAISRDIEAFVPYNNAAVQGTYRVLRAFKKNPVRTVAAIGALSVAPKMYEYAQFADDPDYQNLPERERMRYLIVKKNDDGTFTRIPMDPAYNSFGEATIAALRAFKDNDPQAFKGFADALANAWTPPMVTGALQGITKGTGAEGSIAGVVNSTIAAPFVASVSNQSFTGLPIVSKSLQDRSRPYQYDERTSSIAKTLGKYLDMSPQKVDYIMRSYGGDPARLLLPLTSDVGKGNVRNTLLKNFIVDPAFSNTLTDDFYTAKDKLNQAYADYNEAGVELPSWYDDNLRKELNSTSRNSVSSQLADLRDYKREVTADKSISNEERTAKLRDIQQQINQIYIDINSVLQETGVIK
ncbi:hypothetical protein KIH86_23870 [Paenibacillus sp. HN-1]|uniref:LPD38 domain-containing protein n=1 Tax=Paenibacillus TaxID=44249 RepID=UPI001CA7BBB3|nr:MULTISPECIES: LPD38 domain-containing protein [Paenibacillus]MBY9081190.1 hypothetical protein [Paenibacillus sp. CGMCC 1.18879]MBY9087227.1 hypothetical protein [Paenibacillus sinensis]